MILTQKDSGELAECLKEMYEKCPYSVPHAEVVTCMFQNDANLVGALSCWMKENQHN